MTSQNKHACCLITQQDKNKTTGNRLVTKKLIDDLECNATLLTRTKTNQPSKMKPFTPLLLVLAYLSLSAAFVTRPQPLLAPTDNNVLAPTRTTRQSSTSLFKRISQERRRQLGILDDEDEYDLGFALESNTDPLISKIIAGSLIVVIIALLTVGVIIPLTTDYGEGVCNPILNQGRC